MTYVVRFDLPGAEAPVFAAMHKGAFGWSYTLETAELYDELERAESVLENAYPLSMRLYGRVARVEGGEAV